MRGYAIVMMILVMALSMGCSNGNNSTISPPVDLTTIGNIPAPPVFVSDRDSSGNPFAGMGMLGIFQGKIDANPLKGEIVPLRNVSSTDALEVVDITNFLRLAPCTNCVKIGSIGLDPDGNIVAKIGIRHPFPTGDPFKPITGRNRADLHVFNVEGIVAFESSSAIQFPSIQREIASGPVLKNADGFTGYLDPYLDEIFPTQADIHPYKLHFRDYTQGNFSPSNPMGFDSVTDPPPSGNLVMAMGCDYDYQDYIFDIPDNEDMEFIFAVGCTYALSAITKSERFTPEYRIPQHNKKAASEVHIQIVSNNLRAGDSLSAAQLNVQVLDMNHGVSVGTELDKMAFDSSVSAILIEIPGVTSGAVNSYTANGGDGHDPSNPLSFLVDLTNQLAAGNGIYNGLVKVLDSFPVGQNGSPLLNGKDGIQRVDPLINPLNGTFDIDEFATYASFEIEISGTPEDPVAIIKTTPDPANLGPRHQTVIFDGSDSYDPDGGPITLFEWDFDWDGDPANFSPDVSGSDAVVDHEYGCMPGQWVAALRVTDDDTPAGVSQIASVDITLVDDYVPGEWETPVAFAGERINGNFLYMTAQGLQMESNGLVHIITHNNSKIFHRT